MQTTLRAILFDFDGVLANTEPVHLQMFQKVLSAEGIGLTREAYFEKYLGLDDRACIAQVYRDAGKVLDEAKAETLVARKNAAMLGFVKGQSLLLPGAREVVEKASDRYFLAVVSGALRNEIETILEGEGLRGKFHVIVAADDVSEGKPSPEGFLAAIRLLNRDFVPEAEILLPEECLAIEDSPWGLDAAKQAGVRGLAVTTSYARERLRNADLITKDLSSLPWNEVESLFRKS